MNTMLASAKSAFFHPHCHPHCHRHCHSHPPTTTTRTPTPTTCSSLPIHPLHPKRRLQTLLQRLQATTTLTPLPSTTPLPTSPTTEEDEFLSPQERSTLSADQKQFMVRKRKAALGLGPVMPTASSCHHCDGIGSCVCHQCHGTGLNATNKSEELFTSEGEIIVRNGLVDVQWMFVQDCPCWLCRGSTQVACPDCGGSGIRGGTDKYTGD